MIIILIIVELHPTRDNYYFYDKGYRNFILYYQLQLTLFLKAIFTSPITNQRKMTVSPTCVIIPNKRPYENMNKILILLQAIFKPVDKWFSRVDWNRF